MTENTNLPREPRRFRLDELFTEAELRKAAAIFGSHKDDPMPGGMSLARKLCRDITEPALERINRVTAQENNAMYLAYALEHAFTQFLSEISRVKL